jgi:riboflavin kinase/FMN adenylyltransferase
LSAEFIRGLDSYPIDPSRKTVVTIGTFDGIHLGHQALLQRVREATTGNGLAPVLVTFHPHPKVVVNPDNIPMLLTTIEEKEQFIPDFFDGKVLVMDFNNQLRNMTAEQFVKDVLIDKLNVSRLIVGYDHGFGKNREGTIDVLRQMGEKFDYDLEVVEPVYHDGDVISSSRIRRAVNEGRWDEARTLLGHDYAIFGYVERGIGLGHKLGYPTANVRYSHRKLLPPQGVYACWAQINGRERNGMMFVGQNHFNPVEGITVEANLFDFDEEIYDDEVVVFAADFIRENRRFESTDALVEQIHEDKEKVLSIFRKERKKNGNHEGNEGGPDRETSPSRK